MMPHDRSDAQVARAVRLWLEQGMDELPDGAQLPPAVRDLVVGQVQTTPQDLRWRLGRRLGRRGPGAGDGDSRGSRRLYGFAALLAAGIVGTTAILGGISQWSSGHTIVVAQDGSGDVSTIAAGVALAADGDTVLIRPGIYRESLVVAADITLRGDGDREAVVVETPEDGPRSNDSRVNGGYALQLEETAATIRGLTLRGEHSRIVINGGAPTLQDLHLQDVDEAYTGGSAPWSSIHINAASTAVIRDCYLERGGEIGIFDGSSPVIEHNELRDGPHIWLAEASQGSAPIIRGNSIAGFNVRGIGTFSPADILIEGNTVDGGVDAIELAAGAPDREATVRGNTISAQGHGILVHGGAPTIADNVIRGATTGVALDNGDGAVLTGNQIRGNETGIQITVGLPQLRGNTLCENRRNVRGPPGLDLAGNEVCAELSSPPASGTP